MIYGEKISEALERKQEQWLETTAVLSTKDDSVVDKGGSSRPKEKWADRDICDFFAIQLAKLGAR